MIILIILVVAVASSVMGSQDSSLPCRKFSEIYINGADMCSSMWGDAFTVDDSGESDEESYTLWFYETSNPNLEIASNFYNKTLEYNSNGQPECKLKYYHRDYAQSQVIGDYKECHIYSEASCCNSSVVSSVEKMNEAYGPAYHIDRCGPLSQACENFFMFEFCFYECDPTAGLYRRYSDQEVRNDIAANGTTTWTNTWELYQMPLRASVCNAWYAACYDDYFCSYDGGDFFSCALEYQTTAGGDDSNKSESSDNWTDEMTVITVIVSSIGIILLILLLFLVYRERMGKAVFRPLNTQEV